MLPIKKTYILVIFTIGWVVIFSIELLEFLVIGEILKFYQIIDNSLNLLKVVQSNGYDSTKICTHTAKHGQMHFLNGWIFMR